MALSHSSKVFGARELRITQLLTDVSGSACTYAGVTTAVVASPAPTTTSFSVTPGGGATLTVGRTVTVGTQFATIATIVTDAITTSNTLATAPSTGEAVFQSSGYQLVGVKDMTVTTTMKTVDLRGDNTYLDTDSVLEALEFDVDVAKVNLDAMAIMLGGTVVDSGTTPNQVSTWSLPTQPTFNYFKLEARCFSMDTPGGDIHIVCNKAKAADAPIFGLTEEDYNMPKIKVKAVPPVTGSLTPWMQVFFNQTAIGVS